MESMHQLSLNKLEPAQLLELRNAITEKNSQLGHIQHDQLQQLCLSKLDLAEAESQILVSIIAYACSRDLENNLSKISLPKLEKLAILYCNYNSIR